MIACVCMYICCFFGGVGGLGFVSPRVIACVFVCIFVFCFGWRRVYACNRALFSQLKNLINVAHNYKFVLVLFCFCFCFFQY